ncbi:MAG: inorganic phosphate transporter, partial [Methyloceanibacter sp.]|nr:inorganic phosphate transporter [Methyloceanibacter sp.]
MAGSLTIIIALVAVALIFDFLHGLHDAANSIATIVSTRVLSPGIAVAFAAFFNFIAFLFFGLHVAQTIGTGLIAPDVVDWRVIFGALMGAISWNLITWWAAIPSSSSHALIGGLVGAGTAKAGMHAIVWPGLLKTGGAIVWSPLLGFVLALFLWLAVAWLFRRATPYAVDNQFRVMQLFSAAAYSMGHGANDAQKTMGIIAVLLFSQGQLGSEFRVPFWVVIACQIAMG